MCMHARIMPFTFGFSLAGYVYKESNPVRVGYKSGLSQPPINYARSNRAEFRAEDSFNSERIVPRRAIGD